MNRNRVFFLLLGVLILSSCQQHYWFRQKVRVHKVHKKSIRLEVVNLSPDFLSGAYEQQIRAASLAKLEKKGFVLYRDTPDFVFTLYVHVDSFYLQGFNDRFTNKFLYYPHTVKSIVFNYRVRFARDRSLYWENDYDLYFFNSEKQDTKRSVGVVKYCIGRIK